MYGRSMAEQINPYPAPVKTENQRQVFDCARCLLAQEKPGVKIDDIVACTELPKTTVYTCMQKFGRTGVFNKEPGQPDGHHISGKLIVYVPNPNAMEPVTPVLQPHCPTIERLADPLNLIPSHFTPSQRRLVGCMACMHQRHGSSPSDRLGITTTDARDCTDTPMTTVMNTFERSELAGLIERRGTNGRQVIYRATQQGERLFDTLAPDVTCGKEWPEDRLDPIETRAEIIRCLGCLSFQRRKTGLDTPITAGMVGYCKQIGPSRLFRQIAALEKDNMLQRLPHKPPGAPTSNPRYFQISPTPALLELTHTTRRPDSCNLQLPTDPVHTIQEADPRIGLVQSNMLERWHILQIANYYPETEWPRAVRLLERLYMRQFVKTASIYDPVASLEERKALRIAHHNRTFDPSSGAFVTFGDALVPYNDLQRQVILHVFGGDLLVYGRRLTPAYLRAMLNVGEDASLPRLAQLILSGHFS